MRRSTCKGIAGHFNISWNTIRDVEKSCRADKYRHISLGNVNGIALDEMKVFNKGKVSRKFITMARDAETGNVLSVTGGKGSGSLKMFTSRMKRPEAKVKYVCVDMSNAYGAWAKSALPKAEIVYDKFHPIIKAMNERLDHVRRWAARNLDEDVAKDLKDKKFR